MRQLYEMICRRGWRLIVATTVNEAFGWARGDAKGIFKFIFFATVLPRGIKKEFEFTGFYSSTKVSSNIISSHSEKGPA
jgi:hypothetical protein